MLTNTNIHITYTHSYSNIPSTHTLSHTNTHLYVKIFIHTHTHRVWELTKWRPWVEDAFKLQREGERNSRDNNPVRQLLQKLSKDEDRVTVELLNAKEVVYWDLHSSSSLPLLPLRPWPCCLYLMLSQFSSLLHGSYRRTYLTGLIRGLNEMMCIDRTVQCPARSEHSIYIQFLIFSGIPAVISED